MTSKYIYVDGQFLDNSYLAHYGVKGMKWGVRRSIAAKTAGALGAVALTQAYRKRKIKKMNANRNKGYTDAMVKSDRYNKPYYRNADSFVYDVNKAMNRGMDRKAARAYATKRAETVRAINGTAAGLVVTHKILSTTGKMDRVNNGTIDAADYVAKVARRKLSRKR